MSLMKAKVLTTLLAVQTFAARDSIKYDVAEEKVRDVNELLGSNFPSS